MQKDRSQPTIKARIMDWARHAFKIDSGTEHLNDEDHRLLDKMAAYIAQRQLTEVAIMSLETARPLNFMGSQILQFFKPFVHFVFTQAGQFDRFSELLENRDVLSLFIEKIENAHNAEKPKEQDHAENKSISIIKP